MAVKMTGGGKLQALLRKAVAIDRGPMVRVGFMGESTYTDHTPVAAVALANEFGDPAHGRPPRPFFRNMIAAKSPGWGEALAAIVRAQGQNIDPRAALDTMGEGIKLQLIGSIETLTDPSLSPKTIARKGFDKPLLDTDVMRDAVASELVDVNE